MFTCSLKGGRMSRWKTNKTAYTIQAKPEIVCGREYDSKLEANMARLLMGNNVIFTTHTTFELYTFDGQTYTYSPDFIFPKAMDFIGIEKAVNFIEVKGVFNPHDFRRLTDLENQFNVKGFIVTEQLMSYWSRFGLFKKPHPEWSNKIAREQFWNPERKEFE